MPINQLLRAALRRVRSMPGLAGVWKHRLRAQLAQFDEVTSPLRDFSWVPGWEPTPMERHYETAVRLAHLILSNWSIQHAAGDLQSNAFLLNMNDLFEKWVTRSLTDLAPGVRVVAQHEVALGTGGSVPMNPDITLWRGGEVVAVADCKYKLAQAGTGRTADYYQALAYAAALGLTSAWLIYARFPGDPEGSIVQVRNGGPELQSRGLDLTGSIASMHHQIGEIAAQVLQSSRQEVPPNTPRRLPTVSLDIGGAGERTHRSAQSVRLDWSRFEAGNS